MIFSVISLKLIELFRDVERRFQSERVVESERDTATCILNCRQGLITIDRN